VKQVWQFKEAKCHFSEVVECALKQGAQTITKHGKPTAVVISVEEYRRLRQPKPSLLGLLRSCPEDLSGVVSFRRNPTLNP
jgi:antitoxin Phd